MVKLLQSVVLSRLYVVDHYECRPNHDGICQQNLELFGVYGASANFQQENLQIALLKGRRPDVDACVFAATELGKTQGT